MKFNWRQPKPAPIEMIPLSSVDEYEQFVRSGRVVVIQFWAGWNGPFHQQMRQNITRISPTILSQVRFGAVDVDIERMWDLLRSFDLCLPPQLAYYENGELVEMRRGLEKTAQIEARLKSLL